MATTTTTEAPKRSQGLLGLFRRAPKDPVESAELAQRKALAQEGHKYLSKATDLINNRDHFHVFERGHLELLQDRWGDLYGAAPKGKKLTKGILSPDEFREKAKILYEDVQAAFDGVRIDRSGPSSSHQSEPPPPPSEQSVHRGHSLRDPGPVPLAHPPERSGSSRDHASRKNSSRHPEDPIPEMGELALNTNDHSSSKRHRDRDRDKARHRPPPLPLDDPLTSLPGQDRSRYDDEAEERDPYGNGRVSDRDVERERERRERRERDRERERERERDKERERERDRERERERDRERERERERERDREAERRHHYRGDMDRSYDSGGKYRDERYRDRYEDQDRYRDDKYYDKYASPSSRRERDRYHNGRDRYEGPGSPASPQSGGVMMSPTFIPYPDQDRVESRDERRVRKEREREDRYRAREVDDRDRYRDRERKDNGRDRERYRDDRERDKRYRDDRERDKRYRDDRERDRERYRDDRDRDRDRERERDRDRDRRHKDRDREREERREKVREAELPRPPEPEFEAVHEEAHEEAAPDLMLHEHSHADSHEHHHSDHHLEPEEIHHSRPPSIMNHNHGSRRTSRQFTAEGSQEA